MPYTYVSPISTPPVQRVPAEWGGQGLSCLEQVISQEQLGRSTNALWDVVWRPANVLEHCNDEQRERYLLPEIRGERRYAYAITEPGAGSDPSRLATTARRDGDAWVIDGEKWFVTVGDVADYLIVVADAEGHGPTTFLVDKDTPGRARAAPAALHARLRLRAPGVRVRGRSRRPVADPRRARRGAEPGQGVVRRGADDDRGALPRRRRAGARGRAGLRHGARAVRPAHRRLPGRRLPARGLRRGARRRPRADLRGGLGDRPRRARPAHAARQGRGREAARLGDGRPRRRPRGAGARRPRLHAREPRRAAVPRPARRPHLGGHVRDPARRAGERARQARPRGHRRLARAGGGGGHG